MPNDLKKKIIICKRCGYVKGESCVCSKMNAFLESGCRCEVCDDFGTKDVPVRTPFVCEKCKEKKETKLFLERKRLSGLIALSIHSAKQSYEQYAEDCKRLEDLLKQQRKFNENGEVVE